jgi:hypothetical protein
VPADFPTIQAAVNAANPGDTINVAPGTYTEQVTIAKDLTLNGASAEGDDQPGQNASSDQSDLDATTIKAPAKLAPGPVGSRRSIVTIMAGAKVEMSDLRVAGPGTGPCSPTSLNDGVLVVQDATLDMRSAAVTDIRTTPTSPPASLDCFTFAVLIGLPDFFSGGPTPAHATMTHLVVSGYGLFGIVASAPGSTATIAHNRVTGLGVHVQTVGVAMSFGATGTIAHNTITDNLCDTPGCGPDWFNQSQSFGIDTNNAGAGTVITDNRLSRNDIGTLLGPAAPGCCSVSNNMLTDNRFFGEVIADGDNTISHDSISGGQIGVGVIAQTVDTTGTLDHVSIKGTSVARTKEISCCGFTARVVVR